MRSFGSGDFPPSARLPARSCRSPGPAGTRGAWDPFRATRSQRGGKLSLSRLPFCQCFREPHTDWADSTWRARTPPLPGHSCPLRVPLSWERLPCGLCERSPASPLTRPSQLQNVQITRGGTLNQRCGLLLVETRFQVPVFVLEQASAGWHGTVIWGKCWNMCSQGETRAELTVSKVENGATRFCHFNQFYINWKSQASPRKP